MVNLMKKYLMSRRKFLKSAGAALVALLVPEIVLGGGSKKKSIAYLKNESLPTILDGYRGNPFINGKFVNEVPKPKITFGDILKWRFSKNPQKEEKKGYIQAARQKERFIF